MNLLKALSPSLSLKIISAPNNGPFQLRLFGAANQIYIIESSPDLLAWSPVFTQTTSAAGTFDFTDTVAANLPQKFFRARAAQ